MPAAAGRPFSVTALITAYNEEDIVAHVVSHLIEQGVQVYFIDHGSTDGTLAAVTPFLGKGVIHIESAAELGRTARDQYAWRSILNRKEALARELQSDWFIHHDADEFRDGPWRDLNLLESIRLVDRLGYNAVDFEVLTFPPTHDRFRPGDDVTAVFDRYEPGNPIDKVQIKCWKNTGIPVDLATSGGHEAVFEGRRVFPLRFLLRHYPIRSQAHGERKVINERRDRFSEAERTAGWHIQYQALGEHAVFVRDEDTLTRYDPESVRLDLLTRNRVVDEVEARRAKLEAAYDELVKRNEEQLGRLDELRVRSDELRVKSVDQEASIRRLHTTLFEIVSTRTWRWSAPLRVMVSWLGGLRTGPSRGARD